MFPLPDSSLDLKGYDLIFFFFLSWVFQYGPSSWVQKKGGGGHATSIEKALQVGLKISGLAIYFSSSIKCDLELLIYMPQLYHLQNETQRISPNCFRRLLLGCDKRMNDKYLFKSYVFCKYTHFREKTKEAIPVPLANDLHSLSGDAFPMPDTVELLPLGSLCPNYISFIILFVSKSPLLVFFLASQPGDLKLFLCVGPPLHPQSAAISRALKLVQSQSVRHSSQFYQEKNFKNFKSQLLFCSVHPASS